MGAVEFSTVGGNLLCLHIYLYTTPYIPSNCVSLLASAWAMGFATIVYPWV